MVSVDFNGIPLNNLGIGVKDTDAATIKQVNDKILE